VRAAESAHCSRSYVDKAACILIKIFLKRKDMAVETIICLVLTDNQYTQTGM
jgi:hypothetical protein